MKLRRNHSSSSSRLGKKVSGVFPSGLALLISLCMSVSASARVQTAQPTVQKEQLLNGLRALIVHRPGASDVLLKLRINSGSTFDLAGKEGLMALLGDAFFDAETREFVKDDLNGRLDVTTSYDSIDITLSGRTTDFERFIDLLRNALVNTQLSPDVVAKLRDARLNAVASAPASPSAIADRLVAARLFGTHPYGRLVDGTRESVQKIDRVDLLVMKERFLNPNNASLVVIGGVEPRRIMRMLRQNLGGWIKSARVVPSTFRQPEAADARTLVINHAGSTGAEVRLAVRGLARSDRDAGIALTLAQIVRARWVSAYPELKDAKYFVRHEPRTESGVFVLGANLQSSAAAAKALESARKVLAELATTVPSVVEAESARQAAASLLNEGNGKDDWIADDLLAEHTYKTRGAASSEIVHVLSTISPGDVQRVASRLFLHTPVATVAVGEATSLSQELARIGSIELFGASSTSSVPQSSPQQPSQPPVRLKRP